MATSGRAMHNWGLENPGFMSKTLYFARRSSSSRGFTLIELLMTVVIIGVLAAIAYPTFMDSIRKSRRSDGFAALTAVQQAQERWRANNTTFAADFGTTVLNVRTIAASGVPSLTEQYYTISVVPTPTATAYRIRAEVRGAQTSDAPCAVMEMRMADGNLTYVSATSVGTLGTTDANRCWSR